MVSGIPQACCLQSTASISKGSENGNVKKKHSFDSKACPGVTRGRMWCSPQFPFLGGESLKGATAEGPPHTDDRPPSSLFLALLCLCLGSGKLHVPLAVRSVSGVCPGCHAAFLPGNEDTLACSHLPFPLCAHPSDGHTHRWGQPGNLQSSDSVFSFQKGLQDLTSGAPNSFYLPGLSRF